MSENDTGKLRKGFACMDPAKQREIARLGGRAAHACGHGHEYTSEEARIAGKKGGDKIGTMREHLSMIGRRGGLISAARRAAKRAAQPA